MIAALRHWFMALSSREQRLVGVAGVLTALVVLIFGIILPGMAAIDRAEVAHDEAVQRRGRIEASVAAAAVPKTGGPAASSADIELIVTQSAAEKGFDLLKSAGATPGQISFRMDQARAPALFAWLTELEVQGVHVHNIALRGGASGSLTVDAQLQKVAR
jgi:general secretion pathway protein M